MIFSPELNSFHSFSELQMCLLISKGSCRALSLNVNPNKKNYMGQMKNETFLSQTGSNLKGLVGKPSPKLRSLDCPPETCPDRLWLACFCDYLTMTTLNYASAYHLPGEVKVTVETEFGEELGVTLFTYIDEMRVMVQQLVKNPILQSFFFDMWSQEAGCLATGNTVTQVLGPLNVSDQGKQNIWCVIFSLPH